MEQLLICIVLAMFGVILGSFAGATVWRLRARQLVEDKHAGEKVDKKEYKKLLPLTKTSTRNDRSRCLHCAHPLRWNDLLPLVSWLSLKGKCRYCKSSIGVMEPLIELGVAGLFVSSYLLWPVSLDDATAITQFALWLIAGVMLAVLFVYDLKWYLLPNRVMFPFIAVSLASAGLQLATTSDFGGAIASLVGAVVILSGLYLVLWLISKGQWIGFGDVKLGLGLALMLGDWQLAFIALFAANLVGCLVIIPGMLSGKITRSSRVPFGPLLISGSIIALFLGPVLIDWYFGLLI